MLERNLLLACSFPPKCCYPSTRIHGTTCRKPAIIEWTVTISPDVTVCVKVTTLLQRWQSYTGTRVTNYNSQPIPGGLYSSAYEQTGGKITMCGGMGRVNSLSGTGFWLLSAEANDDDLAIMIMMMFLLWYMMMMDNMVPFLLMMMITIMMILYCNGIGEQLLWDFTPTVFQPRHQQLPLFHIKLKGKCFLHFFLQIWRLKK